MTEMLLNGISVAFKKIKNRLIQTEARRDVNTLQKSIINSSSIGKKWLTVIVYLYFQGPVYNETAIANYKDNPDFFERNKYKVLAQRFGTVEEVINFPNFQGQNDLR